MGAPVGSNGGGSPGGDVMAVHGQSNGYGESHYYFRFNPKGTGTVTGVNGKYIVSVAYSATGLYLVQLASAFGTVIGFYGLVQAVSGGALSGFDVQLDNSLVNGTAGTPGGTIGVAITQSSSGAYVAATGDANSQVFCHLIVSNNASVSP